MDCGVIKLTLNFGHFEVRRVLVRQVVEVFELSGVFGEVCWNLDFVTFMLGLIFAWGLLVINEFTRAQALDANAGFVVVRTYLNYYKTAL